MVQSLHGINGSIELLSKMEPLVFQVNTMNFLICGGKQKSY